MANLYEGRNRMYPSGVRVVSRGTSQDEFLHGIKPFYDQMRSVRKGGLGLGQHQPGESDYDEENQEFLDPFAQFGSDRFERSEAVASLISDRAAKQAREDLEHAK